MTLCPAIRSLSSAWLLALGELSLFAQPLSPSTLLPPKEAIRHECLPRDPARTATLRVLVVAEDGLELPEASTTLRSPDGVEETRSTDVNGVATFAWLPNTAYEVDAEFPAFVPVLVRPLNARLGCTTELRIELRVSVKECDDSGLPCL